MNGGTASQEAVERGLRREAAAGFAAHCTLRAFLENLSLGKVGLLCAACATEPRTRLPIDNVIAEAGFGFDHPFMYDRSYEGATDWQL